MKIIICGAMFPHGTEGYWADFGKGFVPYGSITVLANDVRKYVDDRDTAPLLEFELPEVVECPPALLIGNPTPVPLTQAQQNTFWEAYNAA